MIGDLPHFETYSILGSTFLVPVHAKLMAAAAMIGLTIGLERAFRRKVASLRTFSFICMGSCLFSIISVEAGEAMRTAGGLSPGTSFYDITRVAAGIVTGVGFLGGGVIFKSQDKIEGITTGAMIWMTAALGMACGFNDIALALWGLILYLLVLVISSILHRLIGPPRFAALPVANVKSRSTRAAAKDGE